MILNPIPNWWPWTTVAVRGSTPQGESLREVGHADGKGRSLVLLSVKVPSIETIATTTKKVTANFTLLVFRFRLQSPLLHTGPVVTPVSNQNLQCCTSFSPSRARVGTCGSGGSVFSVNEAGFAATTAEASCKGQEWIKSEYIYIYLNHMQRHPSWKLLPKTRKRSTGCGLWCSCSCWARL
jgi:hypothetical protein